jgi:hypothetical protein
MIVPPNLTIGNAPGDARVLLVDWVAGHDAAIRAGIFQKAGTMPDLDRFQRGDARTDDLAAAAIACHQVRLDQSRGDLQIGTEIAAVEINRDAVGRLAEIIVLSQDLAVVVLDAVIGNDFFAEHLFQLGALVGPV